MVIEKNKTQPIFSGIVFNASVINIEFNKPKNILMEKIPHFLPVSTCIAENLNPIFVSILKNMASHIE
ncbi:MAG: hypothetical protein RJA25_2667 [Bacteroidota bacterium]